MNALEYCWCFKHDATYFRNAKYFRDSIDIKTTYTTIFFIKIASIKATKDTNIETILQLLEKRLRKKFTV